MKPLELRMYVADIIKRGELYLEIERVRKVLVGLYEHPHADKNVQRHNIAHMELIFKNLLLAKEARQEVVQNIGDDNRGNA